MFYSIGEVAQLTGISISTLRYYDREGMFPGMARCKGGIRVFTEKELTRLRVIECLKRTGMTIKKIKEFLTWCEEGDESLLKRRQMIYEQLEEAKKQAAELEKTIHFLEYKCWYYDTAVAAGTVKAVKDMKDEEIPQPVRSYRV